MTRLAAPRVSARGRIMLWIAVGLGLVLLAAANVDLLRKAVSSEPACVEHVKPGDGAAARGLYSAAGPAC